MQVLGLNGLIHLWGNAGSGKTLLTVALASDASKHCKVEWINTDGKRSFIKQLRDNVNAYGGKTENITVTMTNGKSELLTLIDSLPMNLQDTQLIIIDPITRVLDMARDDPLMWGREIIETVLPTLTGIVAKGNADIIITSESRTMDDSQNKAVHHSTITRWTDHDLRLLRDVVNAHTQILESFDNELHETALMKITGEGIIEIIPRMVQSHNSGGDN